MSDKEGKDSAPVEAVTVEGGVVAVESSDIEGDACSISGEEKSIGETSSVGPEAKSEVARGTVVPEKALPVYTCSFCGKLPPGEEVWQCTLCLQKFCVNHLEPRLHFCYSGQAT